MYMNIVFFFKCLREYLPLKQGLRHIFSSTNITFMFLREYLPLKQGLRLTNCLTSCTDGTQRVSSIKTRIKTLQYAA